MSWRNDAACRGTDPAVFFPERATSPEPALAICARCPVRAECLDAADDDGIWGGTTAVERKPRRATR
jgi:WhiB family redox-sensing transcriptional regulator